MRFAQLTATPRIVAWLASGVVIALLIYGALSVYCPYVETRCPVA